MRLFIENKEKSITVVEAMTVEWDEGSDVITVFDYNDNRGSIKIENDYTAARIMRNMSSSSNVIKIEGELDWQ